MGNLSYGPRTACRLWAKSAILKFHSHDCRGFPLRENGDGVDMRFELNFYLHGAQAAVRSISTKAFKPAGINLRLG